MLCSSTGASSGELCFGSHALKNAAVGVPHIIDTLEARAESLRQMCNADAEAEAAAAAAAAAAASEQQNCSSANDASSANDVADFRYVLCSSANDIRAA